MCLWAGGWHVDGKQLAAVLRIKALRRLHCCALLVLCWGAAGMPGKNQNFDPRPLRPGFFLSCGKLAVREALLLGRDALDLEPLPPFRLL
jgi:hypothetical protein